MQNGDAEKHKADHEPDNASPLTWVEYAIAAAIITIVVIGIVFFIAPLPGMIFSNITRGLTRE